MTPIPGITVVGSANVDLAPFLCLNAAPARGPIELEPDLLIVNRYEYKMVGTYDGLRPVRGAQPSLPTAAEIELVLRF